MVSGVEVSVSETSPGSVAVGGRLASMSRDDVDACLAALEEPLPTRLPKDALTFAVDQPLPGALVSKLVRTRTRELGLE